MEFKYKRVLIKLSGEAIGKEDGRGIDNVKLSKVVEQIIEISKSGVQIAIVIGAGNFWRGKYGQEYMERTTSDYMGMLATTLNALALQDMIESKGIYTRVMTALEIKQVAEPYIRRKAVKHLEKGRIVIFACGTGNPYFTTDTTAALRAVEVDADIILLAKNIDGVYDKDPNKYSDAKKYDEVTYMQAISERLAVMDATAITLCMENKIPIRVFALNEKDSIKRAINGEKIGTIIEK
ncbi:MAG: UMP kinase [Clostridia bacterium]|nr:UMP kinase [Clostridia bacterium]